jgi:hypothetical protein
MAGVEVV